MKLTHISQKITFLFSLLVLVPTAILANTVPPNNQVHYMKSFCPQPWTLKKDQATKLWSAPGDEGGEWKSYNMSLFNKVDRLIEVQWQGIVQGVVFCIYQGAERVTDFNIALEREVLVPEPKGKYWKDTKEGKVCHSGNPLDCPFMIEIKKPEDIKAIYHELGKYK